ncbi:zinc-binding dehydrogenase [Streptomyces lydicus]|uniref:zinc-binding dehydrogenase n=1 Tax=Streptomyces lydicus TaxID=47763 RepID=UPI0037AFFDE6
MTDPVDGSLEFGETARPLIEAAHDQERPLVPDHAEDDSGPARVLLRLAICRGHRYLQGIEGRLLVIGSTGGDIAQIKIDTLMYNNLSVSGVGWGAFWREQPSYLQEQWAGLLPLLQAGELQPVIGRRFPLEQASQALLELDQRRAQGKVLLDVR